MKSLAVKPRAANELAEVVAWLERERDGLGRRFERLAQAELGRACEFPLAYPVFVGAFRRIMVDPFKYGLIYVVEAERIVLVAIVDLRREPRTIERRLREES